MTELGYKTLRESIVDIIRKRIINRELQPGQKIVEQELAKEFKTSRAPIREAPVSYTHLDVYKRQQSGGGLTKDFLHILFHSTNLLNIIILHQYLRCV